VRIAFAKDNAGVVQSMDTNNYYPFGLNHIGGSSYSNFGSYYNYKYNGKELEETGMYDYGARMYMADIGRWGVVDPLAEVNRAWSPYRYAYNNPLRFIDPDGRLEDWYQDEAGDYVYDANLTDSNAYLKLSNKEKYLGSSHSITLVNSDKQSVGNINLEEGGSISVSGEWAEAGNVSYETIGKESGFGLIVDAKLTDGAKIYDVDKLSQDNYNKYNNPEMEFSADAKELAQDSFKGEFKSPESTASKVVNGVVGATSGSGVVVAPNCSQCPPSTAGPGPVGTVPGPSNKAAYDGYKMGIALNHLLWHDKKTDNNEKKK
jgi:RHS repeat-associated protein